MVVFLLLGAVPLLGLLLLAWAMPALEERRFRALAGRTGPEEMEGLAERMRSLGSGLLGQHLEYTEQGLGLVAELSRGGSDRLVESLSVRAEEVPLFLGAFYGEVTRNSRGGEWRAGPSGPILWSEGESRDPVGRAREELRGRGSG